MSTLFLQTPRLALRQFTAEDVDFLVELDSDPHVMRFISDGQPTPAHKIRGEVLPLFLRYHAAYDDLGFWVAIERDTGRAIGWFHFRPAHEPSQGIELGYRLRRSAWGRGYATEGSRELLRMGFSTPGIRRVIAHAMLGNRASTHVMEKLGMRFEKTYLEERFPGEDKTAVQYAISRERFVP